MGDENPPAEEILALGRSDLVEIDAQREVSEIITPLLKLGRTSMAIQSVPSLEARASTISCDSQASSHELWFTPRSSATSFRNNWTKRPNSSTSYFTSPSRTSIERVVMPEGSTPVTKSPWQRYLEEIELIPAPDQEQDWSGRGQHVEYLQSELNDIPLVHERYLGCGAAARVESVRCRRLRLALKTIKCHRRFKREDAIQEVRHLQRLQHTHIIQVVGTYVWGHKLSILLYPVAEYNLDSFLEEFRDMAAEQGRSEKFWDMIRSLRIAFGCLATAVDFIHSKIIKHMDIKPKNILLKDKHMGTLDNHRRQSTNMGRQAFIDFRYKVILADFGIARSYSAVMDANTESPTSFTRAYASPEVVKRERRGLSADVFSLGCVYLEMIAVCADVGHSEKAPLDVSTSSSSWDTLLDIRTQGADKDGDGSYQGNLRPILHWLKGVCPLLRDRQYSYLAEELTPFEPFIARMLDRSPNKRPTSSEVRSFFNERSFSFRCQCNPRPDPYEAA